MLIEILCVNYLRIEARQILDGLSSTLPKDFTVLDWILVEQRCLFRHHSHAFQNRRGTSLLKLQVRPNAHVVRRP